MYLASQYRLSQVLLPVCNVIYYDLLTLIKSQLCLQEQKKSQHWFGFGSIQIILNQL